MPNPRNPGNPNDPRSQQYGWAYGGGQSAPSSGPEPTNVMPTVGRPPAGSPPPAPPRGGYDRPLPEPGQIAPTPGYDQRGYGQQGYDQGYQQQGGWNQPSEYGNGGYGGPGGPGDGNGGGRGGRGGRTPKPKKRHPFRRFVAIVMIPVLILVGAVAWIGISAWNKVDKVPYEPTAGERPADQPGKTYLIVASDSREGLTAKEKKKLSTGDAAGSRTDTIKLLHTGAGKTIVVTLPRDSIVPIPGHGETKINAAFAYGGPELLVQTIEQNTGVRIDGYVEIGMGGLARLVDGVGGIEICPKKDMKDPKAGLDIQKGCQEVDGVTALAYSRSRYAAEAGDLGRGANQTEVISAIGKKATSPATLLNPFKLAEMGTGAEGLKVGEGMSVIGGAQFLWAFKALAGGSAMTCGVPIRDFAVNWRKEDALTMFGHIKNDTVDEIPADICTPTGLPE
ncbi:LCP family protein [Nocardioides panzhihuensis]|uniref:LCP family protein required for cell wall assembly n=1 Tax=Nocardioides panzhihuensis TaxID=860243 RepID=A0A7Z0ITX2_9ACTN|nr:LCP family protein [Nocardioides panzhihuensis]NYI79248.1 LCP family protein required for cell wall assembly [Nocardioides panzhihuensis]